MKNSGRGSSAVRTSSGRHSDSRHRVCSHSISPAIHTNGVPGILLVLRTFSTSSLCRSLNGLSSTSACTPGSPAAPSSETAAPIEYPSRPMRALGMRLRAKAMAACSSSTSLMPNVTGARSLPGMPRYE